MKYAAYGSNLHPLRLSQRISSAQLVSTGYLPDWSLHFHKLSKDDSGKCNIRFGGKGVHVAIFEISARDKLTLDQIEGVGAGYSEITLYIPGVGECASYVAMESHIDDSLRPYDWYKELVLIGARSHGFPDDYVDQIESVPACSDTNQDRRQTHSNLIELLKRGR
ncbi:MAG: gamma-glutamylcyclotransferase [Woeseiaceae bacterium]|jgi:gamma-glutamylcyclotransferase